MRTALASALLAFALAGLVRAQQADLPAAPGVYAETNAGTVPLKKTFTGFDVAGSMSTGSRTRVMAFPISTVDDVPMAASLSGFIVNLATVDDSRAASAQMRFCIGDHVREPEFEVMAITVGKFRTGVYRIASPQMTHAWLNDAYAKLTNSRKWRNKHPPAVVGLILGDQMYPVRIEEKTLTEK